jgi:drug/metabolite transporter (DMT)-like permease
VLILPATRIIDGERITVRAWTGALIAVAGIAVLSMGASEPTKKVEAPAVATPPAAEVAR